MSVTIYDSDLIECYYQAICCCQFMARSVGDKLQSCTSSNSFVVTFVHKRCRLLLMSANSWEEAKCLMCGWDDSLPTRAPGKLTLPRSRLSTDGAMRMAHTVTPWQNDRPSLLNLQIYCWSWALVWSEHSGYEPHGEIENWSSPGLLLCLLFFLWKHKRFSSAGLRFASWPWPHWSRYIFVFQSYLQLSEDLNCSFMTEVQILIHSWIRSDVPFLR